MSAATVIDIRTARVARIRRKFFEEATLKIGDVVRVRQWNVVSIDDQRMHDPHVGEEGIIVRIKLFNTRPYTVVFQKNGERCEYTYSSDELLI